MHSAVRTTLAGLLLFGSFMAKADVSTGSGTLNLQVERLASEVTLSTDQQEDVRYGGITWGLHGKEIVLVQVEPRFVDLDYGFTTRYGFSHSLQLPAGTYAVTVVGLEPRQSYSIERLMHRAAFVNSKIRTVTIEAGKTTGIRVAPVIPDEDATKPFIPTFLASITAPDVSFEDTDKKQVPSAISLRGRSSIAWPDYRGAVKFVPR
ncbi:hypothetical protein [Stenotrophomonas oahuensis]|uniref:DUF2846 domain-containing protein n=1 Tax=Stenotrophomonas oahuensis TaxID=3003271 RepID=A0ABY9YSP3_9GAMM|nr:hypothetical protein [Stenotrophomonas sp. A5586]WNH53183.1 hypothetical protein PDM29_02605 [Stenotrophomonas sp. A5586]